MVPGTFSRVTQHFALSQNFLEQIFNFEKLFFFLLISKYKLKAQNKVNNPEAD